MQWNGWGVPVDLPAPPGSGGNIPPWTDLKFNPLGIFNLRRRLGALPREPGVFMQHKSRFLASDIAWFAAGLHNDGQHLTSRDTFHPLFKTAREHTGTGEPAQKLRNKLRDSVRDLVFDTSTLWDRAYGGCTMIIHIDGTTQPSTPALPEFLKAHVYIPPYLLAEFPESHESVARAVQTFIEGVGVPTVMRWRRAAEHNGWSLTQKGHDVTPSPQVLPLIPPPISNTSSYYVFPGRPYGSLSQSPPPPSPVVQPIAQPEVDTHATENLDEQHLGLDYDGAEPDGSADLWLEIDRLQTELAESHSRELEQEDVIMRLREEVQNLVTRQDRLRASAQASTQPAQPMYRTGSSVPPRIQTNLPRHAASHRAYPSSSASPARDSSAQRPISQITSSSSTSRSRPQTPQSALRPQQVRFAAPIEPPSPLPTVSRPSSSSDFVGGLQSFGPSTESFIEEHNLGDRLHRQLHELYDNSLSHKWHTAIGKWFDGYGENQGYLVADGLYTAMCADVRVRADHGDV